MSTMHLIFAGLSIMSIAGVAFAAPHFRMATLIIWPFGSDLKIPKMKEQLQRVKSQKSGKTPKMDGENGDMEFSDQIALDDYQPRSMQQVPHTTV